MSDVTALPRAEQGLSAGLSNILVHFPSLQSTEMTIQQILKNGVNDQLFNTSDLIMFI